VSHLAVASTGLVTSVGLTGAATCAAIRAAISNHTETDFINGEGDPIMGAQVVLAEPWQGLSKLVQMLWLAVDECLMSAATPAQDVPLLLCVSEPSRPGRLASVDDELFLELEQKLDARFHPEWSGLVPHGRVGIVHALLRARDLIDRGVPAVLIAASDSLLIAPTLSRLDDRTRLLTESNSNGFVPGEAAGAVLVTRCPAGRPHLRCMGLGTAHEAAFIDSDRPLRGDGLTRAIEAALQDAQCAPHDLDYRITDNSGEHYYFKEAALAISRTLKVPKAVFEFWHPADCIGETGAAVGFVAFTVAVAAAQKGYAPGSTVLVHLGNDEGHRGAAVLRYVSA
jgi:3-oxoacyl-[acyl-carrier-protein] synthase-1